MKEITIILTIYHTKENMITSASQLTSKISEDDENYYIMTKNIADTIRKAIEDKNKFYLSTIEGKLTLEIESDEP